MNSEKIIGLEPVEQFPQTLHDADADAGDFDMSDSVELELAQPDVMETEVLEDPSEEQLGVEHKGMAYNEDTVEQYLQNIGKVALLSKEQVVELSKRIEAGLFAADRLQKAEANSERLDMQLRRDLQWIASDGKRAKDHLLEANLRLVVSIAKRYTGRGLAFEDVIQDGNLGLIRAVEKFDYTKGFTFSTYATWWIRQSITHRLIETGQEIHLPRAKNEALFKFRRTRERLTRTLECDPTVGELAKELGWTYEQTTEVLQYPTASRSLDEPVEIGERSEPLLNFIDSRTPSPETIVVEASDREARAQVVYAALRTLSTRRREVLALYYKQGLSFEEIGERLGIKATTVSNTRIAATKKLAEVIGNYISAAQ